MSRVTTVARKLGVALLLLPAAACGGATVDTEIGGAASLAAPAYGTGFWSHWGDGRAELAGYELTYSRYGEPRRGTAVTIFVTEPFSESRRVKHELPDVPESGVFQALKLNLVQDFPTGIYDYNLMTSTFVTLEPRAGRAAGTPAKVAFSSQEWCGQVYSQAWFGRDGLLLQAHSYFDGEGDVEERLDYPSDGVAEDALFLWARGLAAPALSPGERREVRLLRSLELSRLDHLEPAWERATLERSAATERIRVPAGEFEVELMTVTVASVSTRRRYPPGDAEVDLPARRWSFFVERESPHRLIRWSRDDRVRADLLASDRLPYWTMNGPGLERALERLGLRSRPARTP
jgi:hypothetical protein